MTYLLAALFMATPVLEVEPIIHPPTVNLSAVRPISCLEGTGSGFVIGKDILATALHVASLTNCRDGLTNVPLKMYHADPKNDFALMSGDYPDKGPFIRYSCSPYKEGHTYLSVGWRGMLRLDRLVATGYYTKPNYVVEGTPLPGMQRLKGGIVPGMSGGMNFDPDTGLVYGINNVVEWNGVGEIHTSYSYEIKNTVLCKR